MNIAERFALRERPRRLRSSPAMRALVRETHVNLDGLVQPLFIVPGRDVRSPIGSMPGVSRYSVDAAVRESRELAVAGVRSVLLFGVPDDKDAIASGNYDPNGLVQSAARAIKDALPQCWSSPICATANIPITVIAGSATSAATSITIARSRF